MTRELRRRAVLVSAAMVTALALVGCVTVTTTPQPSQQQSVRSPGRGTAPHAVAPPTVASRPHPTQHLPVCMVTATLKENAISVSVAHECRKWDEVTGAYDYSHPTPCEDDPPSGGTVYVQIPSLEGQRCVPRNPPQSIEASLDSTGHATIDVSTLDPPAALGAQSSPSSGQPVLDPEGECHKIAVRTRGGPGGCNDDPNVNPRTYEVDISTAPLYQQWLTAASIKRKALVAKQAEEVKQRALQAASRPGVVYVARNQEQPAQAEQNPCAAATQCQHGCSGVKACIGRCNQQQFTCERVGTPQRICVDQGTRCAEQCGQNDRSCNLLQCVQLEKACRDSGGSQ